MADSECWIYDAISRDDGAPRIDIYAFAENEPELGRLQDAVLSAMIGSNPEFDFLVFPCPTELMDAVGESEGQPQAIVKMVEASRSNETVRPTLP